MSNQYLWYGINHLGERIEGKEFAPNYQQLKHQLHNRDIVVLHSKKILVWRWRRAIKITRKIIADFTQQLAILSQANLELVPALTILSEQDSHPTLQTLIISLQQHIENGATFSDALAKFPSYFDNIYCGLIYAGEQSGTLSQMLAQLADYQEQILNLQAKIIKTLFYPVTILIVALLITSGLLIFIVPQFEKIFKNFGAQLPLFTQGVIALSNGLRAYFWEFLLLIFTIIIIYHKFIKHSPKFCAWRDRQLLSLPILGQLLLNSILARWTKILATLLAAGLPLLTALQIAEKTIANQFFQKALTETIKQIHSGQTFYQALHNSALFPRRIVQMIGVGESSGQIIAMLNKIADIQRTTLDKMIDYFSKWLEPVMMLLIAAVTATLIIAMYLPVFRLGEVI